MASSDTPSPTGPGLRSARWLLVGHLLPAALIIGFYLNAYRLIGTLLDADTLALWKTLGTLLLVLNIAMAVTMILRWRNSAPVPWPIALISLVLHCTLCVFALFNLSDLVPWDIPRWMLPSDLFTVTNSLLMVPVTHALLILIDRTAPAGTRSWPNFLAAIGLATGWYILFLVASNLPYEWRWREYLYVPLMVIASVSFFFFIVRGLLLLVRANAGRWTEHSLIWRAIIGLGLPLTGLIVHHNLFGNSWGGAPIGSFSHPWFYVIAALNGVVFCLRPPDNEHLRLLLLFARAAGFTYVLYFVIVFLPWLPLSFPLIIVFGIGFLMMAPTLLFVAQVGDLLRESRWATSVLGRWPSIGIVAAGILVIPACIWLNNARDRRILQDALAYVYAPDLSSSEPPDFTAADIARLLSRVQQHKLSQRGGEMGLDNEAILTTWYDLQVFDGVTLSEEKAQQLARVFTGEATEKSTWWWRDSMPRNAGTSLIGLQVRSTYDAPTRVWRTQVELTMHNAAMDQSEFGTSFTLPPGAFITDNWLYIGDRKAQGILADRKAATWIYQQIVTVQRQDPSLLRYIRPDELELRVFPFAANETRRAGFEVVTCEPLPLTIEGRTVMLGDSLMFSGATVIPSGDDQLLYVPASVKRTLSKASAKPALWVILDRSIGSTDYTELLIERTNGLLNMPELANAPRHFIAANSAPYPLPADHWADAYRTTKTEGGFFAGRAIEHIALEQLAHPTTDVPIIVLITEQGNNAVITDNAHQLAALAHMPDSWFTVDMANRLLPLDGDTSGSVDTAIRPADLLATGRVTFTSPTGRTVMLPDDGLPSWVWDGDSTLNGPPNASRAKSDWHAGLDLRSVDAWSCVHPDLELTHPHLLTRRSFVAGVLSRSTAFICLESEAQEIALKEKQAEILNASSLFDAGDELKPMSEPAEWIAMLLLMIILTVRWWCLR